MSGTTIEDRKAVGDTLLAVHQRSAYVTAPRAIDTNVIRAVLERKGLRTFSPDQLDVPSRSLSMVIREGMRQADLVVAVVGPGEDSEFIFYELGFAQALDKPTLILLTGDSPTDLWIASGTPYLRFDPANPSGLEFGVDQFLKIPHRGAKPSSSVDRTRPIGDLADALLVRLRSLDDASSEGEYAEIIEDAIRASGVTSVSRGGPGTQFVDMAVWSDDLSPWVANPLPVQLRMRVRNSIDLSAPAMRLLRQITEGGMKWGLIIYHQCFIDMNHTWKMPNLLGIQAERFIETLKGVGFGELVLRLRNERVHGGQ